MNPENDTTMSPEQGRLLSVRVLPARLTAEQAGDYLGFNKEGVSILGIAGLLRPLGKPPRTGPRYYAACELALLRDDPKWLAKCCDALVAHWRRKRLRGGDGTGETDGRS